MNTIIHYKRNLLEQLLELAKNKKEGFGERSQSAQDRANEAEGAMQSRYSTFKEEGQYLAGGLKILHGEFKSIEAMVQSALKDTITSSERIEYLSIVEIKFEDGSLAKFFIFPVMGGEKIDNITIITPGAPIGKAIMFKEVGDTFILKLGNEIRRGEVINVQ